MKKAIIKFVYKKYNGYRYNFINTKKVKKKN